MAPRHDPAHGDRQAATPYWRLSAYYFFYFSFIGAFAPYFTLYLQSLKFSPWDIGVLMSLMQVMRLLAPNLWGWLADRLGAKTPIIRASALMSMLGFACFFSRRIFPAFFSACCCCHFSGAPRCRWSRP